MEEIVFNRPKKYILLRELGSGACGKTVLLRDVDLEIDVVAKKYAPLPDLEQDAEVRGDLLARFRKEAQTLLQATHENVVRVYTYYDYPEASSAYFIMEYVNGDNIVDYAKLNPASCESVFLETISGFCYLANKGIIHRDIRPQNILVTSVGKVKIIDFGFAKSSSNDIAPDSIDYVKSVTLNWYASRPSDFLQSIYDETTEVYFVGALLGEVVRSSGISNFRYSEVIEKMTALNRGQRLQTFGAVAQLVSQVDLGAISFPPIGVATYRDFSRALSGTLVKIKIGAKYKRDVDVIISSLEKLHRTVLLEEYVPDITKLMSIFISGAYTYTIRYQFPVELLANFISLIKPLDPDRREIVLSNLFSRLDAIPRYSDADMDDEIPF